MRFVALAALAVAPALLPAAPVPKAGPPRLIAVSSHKDSLWGVYVVHPDTGESKRLTDPKRVSYGPAWSPDGTRIAFNSDGEIWTMKADGTDVQQITKAQGTCREYRWSPDGTRIAFVLGKDGKDRLHIVEVATGKLTQLTDGSFPCGQPSWSPNGKRLLYSRRVGWTIHSINPDGTDDRKVADGNTSRDGAWSPDGSLIAFAAYSPDASVWQVLTVGADGKGKKLLTSSANNYGNVLPQWSPDGNRIAFGSMVNDVLQVAVVSAAGGEEKVITAGPRSHSFPQWSPDGKSLGYIRAEKGQRGELVVSDPDGSNAKVLLTHVDGPVEWKPK